MYLSAWFAESAFSPKCKYSSSVVGTQCGSLLIVCKTDKTKQMAMYQEVAKKPINYILTIYLNRLSIRFLKIFVEMHSRKCQTEMHRGLPFIHLGEECATTAFDHGSGPEGSLSHCYSVNRTTIRTAHWQLFFNATT